MYDNIFVITGANRGLGYALFKKAWASKRYDKVIILSRSLSEWQQSLLRDSKAELEYLKLDFAEQMAQEQLEKFELTVANSARVTFINNAASILPLAPIGEASSQEVMDSISINVIAPITLTNSLLRSFKGSFMQVINISSGVHRKPLDHWSLYSASKAAIVNFMSCLESECIDRNVRVVNVDPGLVDTNMQRAIRMNEISMKLPKPTFNDLYREGNLRSPEEVADSIFKRIIKT